MSFNDLMKYFDSDAEEDIFGVGQLTSKEKENIKIDTLEEITFTVDIIPTKEESTYILIRLFFRFFDYIFGMKFLKRNKNKIED